MAWEYIKLFMHEGKSALPPSSALSPYKIHSASEAIRFFNPLKVLKVKHGLWLFFAVPFFFLVALPIAPLLMLADICYFWLDCILPKRKWPPELLAARDGI